MACEDDSDIKIPNWYLKMPQKVLNCICEQYSGKYIAVNHIARNEDYVFTHNPLVIDAFQAFGTIAFEMANSHYVEELIAALDETNKKSRRSIL